VAARSDPTRWANSRKGSSLSNCRVWRIGAPEADAPEGELIVTRLS
jgi:hypothetical protein